MEDVGLDAGRPPPSFHFLKGRRVLVTGHTGFKGAWLCLALKEAGAEIAGYALAATPKGTSLFDALALKPLLAFHEEADLRNRDKLASLFASFQPEVVFHLAAQALVRKGYEQPSETYSVNVLGTQNVLEVCSATPSVRALVIATTDKVYAEQGDAPHREQDPLGGADPYSTSKACCELLADAARRTGVRSPADASVPLGIATVRAGNVIGGGDWADDRLVPDCVRAALSGQSVSLRLPTATRPWQHVLDAIFGYIKVAEHLTQDPVRYARAFNIGPDHNEQRSVAEVAEAVAIALAAPLPEVPTEGQPRLRERPTLSLDSTLAVEELGWHPRLDIETALDWTTTWYRETLNGEDAAPLSRRQLREYGARGPRPATTVVPIFCRGCGSRLTHTFVDLGPAPPSNELRQTAELSRPEQTFPQRVFGCDACGLVQLPGVTHPESIFSSYVYFSSYSATWLEHVRRFTEEAASRLGLGQQSFVVEVGSNDGYLLQHYVHKGIPCVGVDPATNVAAMAREKGIPTWSGFFGQKLAEELTREHGQADLVVGFNVVAHVPDLHDFLAGFDILLKPSGTLCLEFPHLLQLVKHTQFDTIYHEHFSYFSLRALAKALAAHGLEPYRVEPQPTHGGSLRVYIGREGRQEVESSVQDTLEVESREKLHELATSGRFQEQVAHVRDELMAFLIDARRQGLRVVGYGAPAKASTLLNYCGVRPDLLPYTVDRSPHKQGRYIPGCRIPIHSIDRLLDERPDAVLVLPWNLRAEIQDQLRAVAPEWNPRIFTAIPKLTEWPQS